MELPWPGYDRAVVIDALAGPIQFNIPQDSLPLDAESLGHVLESGITALNLTVNARATGELDAHASTVEKMEGWASEIAARPEVLLAIRGVGDIDTAKEQGKLGIVFGFQDGVPFEDDLDRLDAFYERGLRIVQPTYNV
ncbi:MAG: membrane dipeptidase, partial [Planctomycetota bacterium]